MKSGDMPWLRNVGPVVRMISVKDRAAQPATMRADRFLRCPALGVLNRPMG